MRDEAGDVPGVNHIDLGCCINVSHFLVWTIGPLKGIFQDPCLKDKSNPAMLDRKEIFIRSRTRRDPEGVSFSGNDAMRAHVPRRACLPGLGNRDAITDARNVTTTCSECGRAQLAHVSPRVEESVSLL